MSRARSFAITRTARARCDVETVRAQLVAPGTWPVWQSEILSTDGPDTLAEGDVVTGRATMLGFEVDGQTVAAIVDGERVEQEVVVGVGMRISYVLEPEPSGVKITHMLVSELPSGPAGRVLSFFLRRRLRKMQEGLLKRLVSQAEASSD